MGKGVQLKGCHFRMLENSVIEILKPTKILLIFHHLKWKWSKNESKGKIRLVSMNLAAHGPRREILERLRFSSNFKLEPITNLVQCRSTVERSSPKIPGANLKFNNWYLFRTWSSIVSACRDFLLKQRKGKFNSLILFTVNIKFGEWICTRGI